MDAPLALGSRHARPPKSMGGIRDINHGTPEQGEERVSSKPDTAKYFRKVAVIGLIVAVAINCFPLLIGFLERDTSGSQSGLNFLFTLQIGALIGLPSLALAIIASIIGIARAWRTSTVRRVMAIIPIVLMFLPIIFLLAIGLAWNDGYLVLRCSLIVFVGLVMFIITGLTGLDKKNPVDESAGS